MKKTLTSLLVLISLASKAQVSNQLIASYNFDSNLNNAAGSSFNGTATGSPSYTTDRFGVASKSLNLDGFDDKVLFGDLPIHGNFSISMWLNAPANAINSNQQSIISKRPVCGVGNFFDVRGLFTSSPNSVNIEALNGSGVSGSGAGANITKDEWAHVVYVFDSLARKTNIYIEGKLSTTRPWDANFITMSNDASFGIANSPCAGAPYKGAMDDLRVYSGPLNANDVLTLYKENNYCKPVGGTISISENKVLDNYPNGALVGKITKTKIADPWVFPIDSLDNKFFTLRNDSVFTNNLTKNSSTIFFKLNTCENKIQKFAISKGNAESFLLSKHSFSNDLLDESGKGFNGKYFLANTLSTASFVNDRTNEPNTAIALNGVNDYYALGNQPWDNANLTISFWLKPMNNTKNSILFSKRAVCGVSNFIDVRYNIDGVLGAEIRNGDGFAHVSSLNTLLPSNKWHHAVIVLDKSKGKSLMYINGVLANTMPWTDFSSLANVAEFRLGASPCSVNNIPTFNGYLDDIRVYALPIMQSDVMNLYNEKLTSLSNSELQEKSIYPNPVIDYLFVKEYAEVFDMFGTKVAEGSEKINVAHLTKGIYLVKSASTISKVVKN